MDNKGTVDLSKNCTLSKRKGHGCICQSFLCKLSEGGTIPGVWNPTDNENSAELFNKRILMDQHVKSMHQSILVNMNT